MGLRKIQNSTVIAFKNAERQASMSEITKNKHFKLNNNKNSNSYCSLRESKKI